MSLTNAIIIILWPGQTITVFFWQDTVDHYKQIRRAYTTHTTLLNIFTTTPQNKKMLWIFCSSLMPSLHHIIHALMFYLPQVFRACRLRPHIRGKCVHFHKHNQIDVLCVILYTVRPERCLILTLSINIQHAFKGSSVITLITTFLCTCIFWGGNFLLTVHLHLFLSYHLSQVLCRLIDY